MEINNFHISNLHFLLSIAVGEYALTKDSSFMYILGVPYN